MKRDNTQMKRKQEGNRLIAEFMGATKQEYNVLDVKEPQYCWRFPGDSFDDMIKNFESETPYHSSWDWLMPVVEKIEALDDDVVDKVWISINGKGCGLWTYFDASDVLRIGASNNSFRVTNTSKTKIEATWLTVINFIKWYNLNPKSNG